MKAAVLHGPGDLRVEEVAVPTPGTDEVLVRVTAVGLCGSDLHWFGHGGIGDARLDRPLVVGHELAGVVEDGPAAGRRVAIDPAVPCGSCTSCAEGDVNLCPTIDFAGHGRTDGGLRELMAWPRHRLYPLPPELTDEQGAMLEPLGVALHAVDLAHLRVGTHVAVLGCGPIGLLVAQLARLAGAASVTAVDPLDHRREAARGLGAEQTVAAAADLPQAAARPTGGRGFDVAFDVTNDETAAGAAMVAARPGARVVLAGIPDSDRTSFRASVARRKGLTLVLVRRMKETYPRAIDLVRRGRVDVATLVTARYPLEGAVQAFAAAARREGLKVVVNPNPPVTPARDP